MNPIESYRDASLDGLVSPPAPAPSKRSSRHSRQPSAPVRDGYSPPDVPYATDGPRGAPIKYPGTDLTGHGLQRSFSQRARGRPYADEAFAEDEYQQATRSQPAQRQSRPRDVPPQDPAMAPQQTDIQPATRQTSRRQQIIQDNIRAAADSVRSPTDKASRDVAPRNLEHDGVENQVPGIARAPTLKDIPSPSDQRDWAPDRSPLQKLEVTLNDISKEEKRARVQEAEMLHHEKTRSQKPPERTVTTTSRHTSQPSTIEDVGLVRGLSNTHKDRLQHSTLVDSRKPDATRLANDRYGFDYQTAQAAPTRSVTITRRSRQSGSGQPMPSSQRAVSSSHAQSYSEATPAVVQSRSVSATQPPPRIDVDDFRQSKGSHSARQKPIYGSDRIPTAQERNASHRAALEQLTGGGHTPASRADSKRSRDDYESRVLNQLTVRKDAAMPGSQDPGRTRIAQLVQPERITIPQGRSIPIGLGVQDSPGLRSIDSPVPTDNEVYPVQRHKRKSSVSFKEPFDRRKPKDEWKAAETARLSAPDFLLEPQTEEDRNKAWWEEDPKSRRRSSNSQAVAAGQNIVIDDHMAEFRPKLFLKCGPLLRYTGMRRTVGEGAKEYWRGTVMMVTQDSQSSYEKPPTLRVFAQPKSLYARPPSQKVEHDEGHEHDDEPLAGYTKMSRIGRPLYVRAAHVLPSLRDLSTNETDEGLFDSSPPITSANQHSVSVSPIVSRLSEKNGERYGRYKEVRGVRLYADPDRDVTFWLFKLEIQLSLEQQHIGYRINGGAASGFWVPAEGQTMNIMFHSCNGFSMSVKPDDFSGPDPLWRDVLNVHQSRPFHVMIGGGDQIYNDKVMRNTQHFGAWIADRNSHYKHNAPFTTEMKEELETFYLDNYTKWFSQGLFAMAGSQIPMINMWDDHDIIDGFGSYPHAFMMSPVFSGVGTIAFKYYMLFQQHSVEAMTVTDEPSWILGYKPGPYIKQVSRSILLDLGKSVAFLALDCRTERMKNQVLSLDTCDMALERCRKEIVEGQTKHLIVLLGVPIAYPRMNWMENVLTSRAMDPLKALGRYGVLKGGFLNKFDGGVEVLDDLDDHWTAHHHKEERNELIKELQDLAAERSVRVTILGGDVHLAAIGQFYSNPKLKIPKDRDHRYMPNVISSAIVNTPPPDLLADTLNKRNKVHHLDQYTDEDMIPMFTHDVDMKKRNNKHLLPRRNWCSITQYTPGRTPPSSRSSSPSRSGSPLPEYENGPLPRRRFSLSRDDVNPRMLFRRLSSRNGPPSAYPEDGHGQDERQAVSFDEPRNGRTQQTGWLGRRTASETRDPVTDSINASGGDFNRRQPPPPRPGFARRPTNMSEKAAKKGNVPAVDAEGNEFDVNNHVNLDGGLDIVLNCEIDRRDPRGGTEPYRLLIPALWYDGSSDREKLDASEGLQRKPTLMNKLGLGGKRGHKAAQNQGAGNWGQDMSETESPPGSDGEAEQQKKKMGFFGNLRKKRDSYNGGHNRDMPDRFGAAAGVASEPSDYHHEEPVASKSIHDQVTNAATTTLRDPPPHMSHQAGPVAYDMLYEDLGPPQQAGTATFNRPPGLAKEVESYPPPQRTISEKGNVLRKNSLKRQEAATRSVQAPPTTSRTYQPPETAQYQPPSQPQPIAEPFPPRIGRTNSYIIGQQRTGNTQNPGQTSRTLYDADSAYLTSQQPAPSKSTSRATSNPVSTGPTSYPAGTTENSNIQRGPSQRSASSGNYLSKQEQILGIGTDHDAFSGNPQQRSLRGNGILGRLGLGKQSASADRVSTQSQYQQHQRSGSAQGLGQTQSHQSQGGDEFGAPIRTYSQGYTGIEAYREKPKRGLSLRDRARNLVSNIEGRGKRNDDEDSYDSEGSYSSENLGETEEGRGQHHPQHHHQSPRQTTSHSHSHHHQPQTQHSQSQPQTSSQTQPPITTYAPAEPHDDPQRPSHQRRPSIRDRLTNMYDRAFPGPHQRHPDDERYETHPNDGGDDDDYSDNGTGSYFSDEEYDDRQQGRRPPAPKRGLSLKERLGMIRMGGGSKRERDAQAPAEGRNEFGGTRMGGSAVRGERAGGGDGGGGGGGNHY